MTVRGGFTEMGLVIHEVDDGWAVVMEVSSPGDTFEAGEGAHRVVLYPELPQAQAFIRGANWATKGFIRLLERKDLLPEGFEFTGDI